MEIRKSLQGFSPQNRIHRWCNAVLNLSTKGKFRCRSKVSDPTRFVCFFNKTPIEHCYFLLSIVSLFLFSCDKQTLDGDTAKKLIIEEYKLPKTVDDVVFTADPAVAKKLLDLGLERDGLVKITKKQTFNEIGNPLIQFTDKGKIYFLPTPQEDIKYKRQRIKLAIKEFDQIKGIVMGKENKTALVEFTITFKDHTPFAKDSKNLSESQTVEAFFIKYDSGWKIDNKKGAYMLMGF